MPGHRSAVQRETTVDRIARSPASCTPSSGMNPVNAAILPGGQVAPCRRTRSSRHAPCAGSPPAWRTSVSSDRRVGRDARDPHRPALQVRGRAQMLGRGGDQPAQGSLHDRHHRLRVAAVGDQTGRRRCRRRARTGRCEHRSTSACPSSRLGVTTAQVDALLTVARRFRARRDECPRAPRVGNEVEDQRGLPAWGCAARLPRRRPSPKPPHPASTTDTSVATTHTSTAILRAGAMRAGTVRPEARGARDDGAVRCGCASAISADMGIDVVATSRAQADERAGGRTLSGEPVRELYTEADLPAGIGGPHP